MYFAAVAAMLTSACAAHGHVAAGASPPAQGTAAQNIFAVTLESSDERLKGALLQLATAPSAEAHRRVAVEYRRLGVLDFANDHFMSAVKLDPTDAASYDALARIWRDWGETKKALAAARQAVSYAPRSAAAANTLGTIFETVGEFAEAKRWYLRAKVLDPSAWYALNNLCYANIMTRASEAVAACRHAVELAPESPIARNNLALAHAAAGDLSAARQWFRRAADSATADYNYGIVLLSARAYGEAEVAFHAALMANPEFTLAASRARQARLAALEEHTSDHN